MNDKIEWYREVLSLEPGSKVFFRLGKLLAEVGQIDEAVSVLRQGLDRHPEFLEARLLLIELEVGRGGGSEVVSDVAFIGGILSNHPSFWRYWADSFSADSPDNALAIRFLAASFSGMPMSWTAVLEKGLKAIAAEYDREGPGSAADTQNAPDLSGKAAAPVPTEASMPAPAMETVMPSAAAALAAGGGESEDNMIGLADSADEADLDELADDMEEAGPCASPVAGIDEANLRTKTMAEILAGQDDYDGALAIYRDLMAAAASGPERDKLAARIAELRKRKGEAVSSADIVSESVADSASLEASAIHDEPSASPSPHPQATGEVEQGEPAGPTIAPPPPKKKLLSALGALADRLETRARPR